MTTTVQFEDLPPHGNRGRQARTKYASLLHQLQQRPGEWARVPTKSTSEAGSRGQVLKKGYGLETCIRQGVLYARWPAE